MKTAKQRERFAANPYYGEYEWLLVQLARAMANGDEAEADRLRDEMDRPALYLDAEELQRLRDLSADLYMLSGEEIAEPYGGGEAALRQELFETFSRQDAARMLSLLRSAAFLPHPMVAFMRAAAYRQLGHPLAALEFARYATARDPADAGNRVMAICILVELRRYEDAGTLAGESLRDDAIPDASRLPIASAAFQLTRGLPRDDALPIFAALASGLREHLLQPSARTQISGDDLSMAWTLYGACLESLGDSEAAIDALTRAVELDPTNADALARRGVLRSVLGHPGAGLDLDAAIDAGVSQIVPYLVRARDMLALPNYDRTIGLADAALQLGGSSRGRAIMHEFRAIARFELSGELTDEVREDFDAAFRLDPFDARLRANYNSVKARAQRASLSNLPHVEAIPIYDLAGPDAGETAPPSRTAYDLLAAIGA